MKTIDFKNSGNEYVIKAFMDIIAAARHINFINSNDCQNNTRLRNLVIENAELAISNYEKEMQIAKAYYKVYMQKKRYNKRFTNKRYIKTTE